MLKEIAFPYTRWRGAALPVAPVAAIGLSSRHLCTAPGERSLTAAGHEAAAGCDTTQHRALPPGHRIYTFKTNREQFANLSFLLQRKHSRRFHWLHPAGGHLVVFLCATSLNCVAQDEKRVPRAPGTALCLPPAPGWTEGSTPPSPCQRALGFAGAAPGERGWHRGPRTSSAPRDAH